jgi:SAM-dependent methyltransferase
VALGKPVLVRERTFARANWPEGRAQVAAVRRMAAFVSAAWAARMPAVAGTRASGRRRNRCSADPSRPTREPRPKFNRRALLAAGVAGALPVTAEAMTQNEGGGWWPPKGMKKRFAAAMETGMQDYELAVSRRKKTLFANIPPGSRILEVGIGTGTNLASLPRDCVVVGLDPNPYMSSYAQRRADGLVTRGLRLELVQGTAERIPFDDSSFDAVVCTLTFCSVRDPERVLLEIQRVLRPRGVFVFIEHVRADEDPLLRAAQTLLTPLQVLLADGCHLARPTAALIRKFGSDFDSIAIEDFQVPELGVEGALISKQISGVAVKRAA